MDGLRDDLVRGAGGRLRPAGDPIPLNDERIPGPHREFLSDAVARLQRDPRLVGVAVGGSIASGSADAFSDVDLRIAVAPDAWEEVRAARREIAGSLGDLLAAFTGEHVGEPRLLICLYGPEPLHVDLMFARVDDLEGRIDEPTVLWQRDDRFLEGLEATRAIAPAPDLQWIEDRFWIWVHYGATKIARGELFEAMDFLAYLRGQVLGPLALQAAGARPAGVRKIETDAPKWIAPLAATVALHEPASCWHALAAATTMYDDLVGRLDPDGLVRGEAARRAAIDYCMRLSEGAFALP